MLTNKIFNASALESIRFLSYVYLLKFLITCFMSIKVVYPNSVR